jgi:hypothetical protein
MKQCTLVVEGCPNKCGITVERREMQNHLDNECMNRRKPATNLQLTNLSQQATYPQATTYLQHHETQHQVAMYYCFTQVISFNSEYNKRAKERRICDPWPSSKFARQEEAYASYC